MLTHLLINNLALVKKIEIHFSSGLNVITGETGAGKSVLINALSLVVGERFSQKWRGTFSKSTSISASFNITDKPSLIKKLHKRALLDLEIENDEKEIIIRRAVNESGVNQIYLNGQKITLTELKEIAQELVDIHSQHSGQSLTQLDFQRNLLDEYARIDLSPLEKIVSEIHSIDEQIDEAISVHTSPERQELLEFYLQELLDANLNVDELNSIEDEYKQCSQIEQIRENLATAQNIIAGENNLQTQLNILNQTIKQIVKSDSNFAENLEIADSAQIAFETISDNLNEYFQKLENAKEPVELETRINELDKLANKHHCKIEELLNIQEKRTFSNCESP